MVKSFNSIITIEVGSTSILDARKILDKHVWVLKDILKELLAMIFNF